MLSSFSVQWFTAYYVTLGALLISYGFYFLAKQHEMAERVRDAATSSTPPGVIKSILKYFLLFTIPGLILSFFPFSWIELLFSIWSLVIIYTVGQMLVQWPAVAQQIQSLGDQLPKKVRFTAFNMISIGIVLFLLCYMLISNSR
ncbi:MAG: hypothetical protein WD381_07390 [Balneolaceae bacterium]